MVTTHTSSDIYWMVTRPRIRIYSFLDSDYTNPIYQYDPFIDTDSTTKPIGLTFETGIDSTGSFSIEIEDAESALDLDLLSRGNRVIIDCSKDGLTWQSAFKGLVRASSQHIYAQTGRNIALHGYSNLIRLNERIINMIQTAAYTIDGPDANDTSMWTNNLIKTVLTGDANYIEVTNDTALYGIFQHTNVANSTVTTFIPELSAELVSLSSAIEDILSQTRDTSLLLDFTNDELVIHNPSSVMTGSNFFVITDIQNTSVDDAEITMYPLGPFKQEVVYDNANSDASRLIISTGTPTQTISIPTSVGPATGSSSGEVSFFTDALDSTRWIACGFRAGNTIATPEFAISVNTYGDWSTMKYMTSAIRAVSSNLPIVLGGSAQRLYRDGVLNKPFPSTSTQNVILANTTGTAPTITSGVDYFFSVSFEFPYPTPPPSTTRYIAWRMTPTVTTRYAVSSGSTGTDGTWTGIGDSTPYPSTLDLSTTRLRMGIIPSFVSVNVSEPVFAIITDWNAANRRGIVEKVISAPATSVKNKATAVRYLFEQMYDMAKPSLAFEFDNLTMPNKLPKAGDIAVHVLSRTGTGLRTSPIQVGTITSVNCEFRDNDNILGLNKLRVLTTGIRTGYY